MMNFVDSNYFCFDGDQLVGTLKSKAATNVIYFLERPNEDSF